MIHYNLHMIAREIKITYIFFIFGTIKLNTNLSSINLLFKDLKKFFNKECTTILLIQFVHKTPRLYFFELLKGAIHQK